ncbi:hypothetical protein PQ456_07875 [Paenibacillus kyungheensis]|uniref:HEAT repeat domain-containing protein n=1 Tax=Paenibacillus kyungheensis TaxID=1452732 RepID=A0AAX3M679_9BACL|nr:hypothetical protein [Paenibacillus kyungheensis]WCT57412.1 hypothetical protein PQ456_07875 [Paenibacillus kyungheensis]
MSGIKKSRRMSIHVEYLLDQLYEQESVDLLVQIKESGQLAAIPYLKSFLFSERADIVMAAENAISDLLLKCPVSELIWLSERCREILPFHYQQRGKAWIELRPETVLHWSNDIHPIQIIMASFHWDGYVREVAVQRLSQFQNGSEIPWLLIRLNDWVSPIRFKAYRALKQKIHIRNTEYFIQSIWLVQRLVGRGKEHHELLNTQIQQLIAQPEARPALEHYMHSTDVYIRQFCYNMMLKTEAADRYALFTSALQDHALVIRLWAARQIDQAIEVDKDSSEKISNQWLDIVYMMLADHFPALRRLALDILSYHFPMQAETALIDGLMSHNLTIRETARRHLPKINPIPYVEYYLDQIWNGNESSLAVAIAGLGETGTAEDAEVIAEYKDHTQIKVRKAVLTALGKLKPTAYMDVFSQALVDSQPGISKIAKQTLIQYTYMLDRERLIQLVLNCPLSHISRNALRILFAFDSWQSLDSLLRILVQTEHRIVEHTVNHLLDGWITKANSQFRAELSIEMKKQILCYLEQSKSVLDQGKHRTLEWIIQLDSK